MWLVRVHVPLFVSAPARLLGVSPVVVVECAPPPEDGHFGLLLRLLVDLVQERDQPILGNLKRGRHATTTSAMDSMREEINLHTEMEKVKVALKESGIEVILK